MIYPAAKNDAMKKDKNNPAININANQQLNSLSLQIEELDNKWKRALADYQNLEKRVEEEKLSLTKFLNAALIEKLLVVLDDLERAQVHYRDKGLAMVVDKLRLILHSEGLKEIDADKADFDPETMDCVELVKGQDNKVVSIVERGYLLHDRVLRPVKVKVGKGGLSEDAHEGK